MNEAYSALDELMNYYETGGKHTYSTAFSLEYFDPNNDFSGIASAIMERIGAEMEQHSNDSIILRKGDVFICIEFDDRNTIYLYGADNLNILYECPFPSSDEFEYESDDYDY